MFGSAANLQLTKQVALGAGRGVAAPGTGAADWQPAIVVSTWMQVLGQWLSSGVPGHPRGILPQPGLYAGSAHGADEAAQDTSATVPASTRLGRRRETGRREAKCVMGLPAAG